MYTSFEDLEENPLADYEYDVIEIHQAGSGNSGTEIPEDAWAKVTKTSDLTSGYYLIVCGSKSVAFDGSLSADKIDSNGNGRSVTIKSNYIPYTSGIEKYAFWYDAANGSIRAQAGYYINWTSKNDNGLATSNSAASLTVTISGGNADIKTSSNNYLRYNSSSDQKRFRFFKSSSYTRQEAVQLYKMPDVSLVPSFSVSTSVIAVGPKATEASFRIEASDEVEWTATSSDSTAFTLSKTAGTGSADIKIGFAANSSTEPRSAAITVATTNEAVETATWTIKITQGPASEGDINDGTPGYDDHLVARRKLKRI